MTDQRQKNRERYPDLAALIDELREAFGDVKVVSLEDEKELSNDG